VEYSGSWLCKYGFDSGERPVQASRVIGEAGELMVLVESQRYVINGIDDDRACCHMLTCLYYTIQRIKEQQGAQATTLIALIDPQIANQRYPDT
jgi:hypothetical protein